VASGGGGMEMSIRVTSPNVETGPSKSAAFPTTSSLRRSGCTYFCATRATSSRDTFSMFER
jgi:hypothetical protein